MNPNAVKITDNIFWTGSLDPDIRVFDIVMYTEFGTTYNSYVVKGKEKTALIEASKDRFFNEFKERVNQVADISKIDYIIVNHTEPDHTGSIENLIELNPGIEIIGSAAAIRFVKRIAKRECKTRVVKDGDSLSLGGLTLKFIMAPFLHWPDTMYTYCPEEKVLFTCDSFGCHYCSDRIFNDLMATDFEVAYKYYFDVIMGPFKPYVLQALEKIEDLEINFVCTGHGPVLRSNIDELFEKYRKWAAPVRHEKPLIAIVYVSCYGYTKAAALSIADGIRESGLADAKLYDLVECDKAEAAAAAGEADGLLIGSPTLIGDALPPIWELLSHINPIIHKDKLAGVFGSYGWSGEACGYIEERFRQLKLNVPLPALKFILRPGDADLANAKEFGKSFAVELDKAHK